MKPCFSELRRNHIRCTEGNPSCPIQSSLASQLRACLRGPAAAAVSAHPRGRVGKLFQLLQRQTASAFQAPPGKPSWGRYPIFESLGTVSAQFHLTAANCRLRLCKIRNSSDVECRLNCRACFLPDDSCRVLFPSQKAF